MYLLAKQVGCLDLENAMLAKLWTRKVAYDDDPGKAVEMIWAATYRDESLLVWLGAYLREPGNWDKLRSSSAFREVIEDGGKFLVSVM